MLPLSETCFEKMKSDGKIISLPWGYKVCTGYPGSAGPRRTSQDCNSDNILYGRAIVLSRSV